MYSDCEPTIAYSESIHTARKQLKHRCCECGRKINAGERYASMSGLVSGEGWWSEYQHLRCYHFARHLNHELQIAGKYACIPFGEIENAMYDILDRHHDDNPNTFDDPLFLIWWFVKNGAEFKPEIGSSMERDFRATHPNKEL